MVQAEDYAHGEDGLGAYGSSFPTELGYGDDLGEPMPASGSENKPKILLMGLRRYGCAVSFLQAHWDADVDRASIVNMVLRVGYTRLRCA